NARAQHVHGMSMLDGADDFVDALGQRARSLEFVRECVELGASRQLALQQQVAGFLERRALGEIVDRVAPVAQLAGATIDVADARAVEIDAFQAALNIDFFGSFAHGGARSMDQLVRMRIRKRVRNRCRLGILPSWRAWRHTPGWKSSAPPSSAGGVS